MEEYNMLDENYLKNQIDSIQLESFVALILFEHEWIQLCKRW